MAYARSLLARPSKNEAVALDEGGAATGRPAEARPLRRPDEGSPKRVVVTAQGAVPGCLAAVQAPAIQGVRVGPP